jgi:hypothetical protein
MVKQSKSAMIPGTDVDIGGFLEHNRAKTIALGFQGTSFGAQSRIHSASLGQDGHILASTSLMKVHNITGQ